MRIEIDQSGKIERTSHNTAIAFSDGGFSSIMISGVEKRKIQKIFREIEKPRIFIYKLFAILIFLLIKKELKRSDQIVIDDEYPGKEHLIKHFLLQQIRKTNPNFPVESIIFKRIGKKSNAHLLAYRVMKEREHPDVTVSSKDILKFILK